MDELRNQVLERREAADRILEPKRVLWTEYEQLLHNQLNDTLSANAKSQVFDPVLPTLAMDRAARVMAQIPTGRVRAVSKNDMAASKLMNLTLEKYIIPNANAQFDFLTKARMVDLYSNVYGNFFTLVDWDVKQNGYVGPDMWMIPIRDVFPQVGAMSLEDSDFIIVRTWRPLSWFKGLKEDKNGVMNLNSIITTLEERTGDKEGRDADELSARETSQEYDQQANKGDGYFEVLSMYEKDRWSDFVPAADKFMRDGENAHDNGELPVACKHSIPLIDDFFGMGDFERGKSMQMTTNSLWNLYLDAVKVSIFPPVIINKNAIAENRSIKWSAAAKWLMKRSPAESAQVMNLTPQGISTFNNAMQAIKGSMLNQFGTTDTATTDTTEAGYGKTPQALKMQAARENARDNVDRFYMERFMSTVMKKFVNLMGKKGEKIQIRLFDEELKEIQRQFPEVKEFYDEKTGKLNVDKKQTGSIVYDYEIVSGSTYVTDQAKQQENLIQLFTKAVEGAQLGPDGKVTSPIMEMMRQGGKEIDIAEAYTRLWANSGIQDWDKIVRDIATAGENAETQGQDGVDDPDAIGEREAAMAMQDVEAQIAQAMQAMSEGQMPQGGGQQMMPQQGQMPMQPPQMPMPQGQTQFGQQMPMGNPFSNGQ